MEMSRAIDSSIPSSNHKLPPSLTPLLLSLPNIPRVKGQVADQQGDALLASSVSPTITITPLAASSSWASAAASTVAIAVPVPVRHAAGAVAAVVCWCAGWG